LEDRRMEEAFMFCLSTPPDCLNTDCVIRDNWEEKFCFV
jgi:hypothetical protein